MTRSRAVLLCGLLLSLPAVPQQNPPQPSATTGQTPAAPGGKAPGAVKKDVTPAPQELDVQASTRFSVKTTEVILPVTITDSKTGKFVSNLAKEDFRIRDEGRPQKISYFYHDTPGLRQNTVIGFLVDTSSSSLSHWDKYQGAIKDLIWGLMPNDPNYTGYLISYSTRAELEMNTTSDPDKLTERVDRMKPGGGSSLYNAIYMACTDRKLVPGEPYQPRRVIIIIGDGHDNASDYTLDQVIELAQRNLVTVFGVSTVSFGASSDDSANLERLAHETGGHVEYPLDDPYGATVSGYLSKPSDDGNYALDVGSGGYASLIAEAINKSVMALQGELQSQYILRYVPDIDPATAYLEKRKITVDVMSLPAGSVKVQVRPYYYASSVGQ